MQVYGCEKNIGIRTLRLNISFRDFSGAKVCKSCRARKMLSNACFLGKIRFDTAENEPAKNLQNFGKISYLNLLIIFC